MKLWKLLIFLLFPMGLFAQVSPQITGAGAPTNPCFNGGQQYVDTTNHVIYNCSVAGSNWVLIGLGNISNNTATTSGSGAPAGNCTSTAIFYINTANGDLYDCPTPGSGWVKTGNVGSGVTGPGSSTNNAVTVWNGTGGTTVADSTQWMVPYALDTGSANAIAITVPGLPTSLTTGTCVRWKAAASSTGATTITVTPTGQSAYAATNLMKRTTGGVAAIGPTGDHVIGGLYEACYDGTQYVLLTPSSTVYTGGSLTAAGVLTGNSNNQLQGSSSMTMTGGLFTKINNENLAGVGTAFVRGQTQQKAETIAADGNVLTTTTPATVGEYRVSFVYSCSAMNTATIGWTATWTDSGGNAQAPTNLSLFQTGVAAPALTFTSSAAADYYGSILVDTNAAGTSIVVKTTSSGTSATCKASAFVERIGV